jgi:hypothetical protein
MMRRSITEASYVRPADEQSRHHIFTEVDSSKNLASSITRPSRRLRFLRLFNSIIVPQDLIADYFHVNYGAR